eukprot:6792596-Ditylum_brightwellii.AAC.1
MGDKIVVTMFGAVLFPMVLRGGVYCALCVPCMWCCTAPCNGSGMCWIQLVKQQGGSVRDFGQGTDPIMAFANCQHDSLLCPLLVVVDVVACWWVVTVWLLGWCFGVGWWVALMVLVGKGQIGHSTVCPAAAMQNMALNSNCILQGTAVRRRGCRQAYLSGRTCMWS